MNVNEYKTLTGKTLAEVEQMMNAKLPKTAFSELPGGAGLTAINTAYARDALDKALGPIGLGWGLAEVESPTITIVEQETRRGAVELYQATATFDFWYKLVAGDGNVLQYTQRVYGSSQNSNLAWALSGCFTAAISMATKLFGFQRDVYRNLFEYHIDIDDNSSAIDVAASPKQINYLKALFKRFGIETEDRMNAILSQKGFPTISELTRSQASTLIEDAKKKLEETGQ